MIDAPPETLAAAGDLLPSFRFVLDDLARVDEADLRAREVAVVGRVALLLLKFARSDQLTFQQLFGKLRDLLALLGEQDTTLTLSYIMKVVPGAEPKDLIEAVESSTPLVKETAMTIAEKLLQQGRLEGERRGERRGERKIFLQLLQLKFGALAADVEARVQAADKPTLQAWTASILTASSLDDVLGSGP